MARLPVYMRRERLLDALATLDMGLVGDLVLVHGAPLDEVQRAIAQVERTQVEVARAWMVWAATVSLHPRDAVHVETILRQEPLIPFPVGGA